MGHIPLLTDRDLAKLDRAIARIDAGVSVYQTHGHPVKPRARHEAMDIFLQYPRTPHPISSHRHVMTEP